MQNFRDFTQKKYFYPLVVGVVLAGMGIGVFFMQKQDPSPVTSSVVSEEVQVQESPDDIRIRHLNLIKKMLDVYIAQGKKPPFPANALEIHFWDTPLVYQGETSSFFYDSIGLNTLFDPVTQRPYSYVLNQEGTKYQIFVALDNQNNSNLPLLGKYVYSVGDSELVIGDGFGNMLSPLQVGSLTSVDIADLSLRRRLGLETFKSCREILALKTSIVNKPKSWPYIIDMRWSDVKVFCDMQTDGGGWTLFYANNGHPESPIKKSYVEMRDVMVSEPILDLSNYNDPHLAGLLDYKHFIQLWSTEMLIRNREWTSKSWVKFTFSSSRIFDWALSSKVLWNTNEGCFDLPGSATWSIINNDGKVRYDRLRQMMNHRWTSWGVSHDKYPCNEFWVAANSFLGFYLANDSADENRARSNENVGGKWGASNEYRYFLR